MLTMIALGFVLMLIGILVLFLSAYRERVEGHEERSRVEGGAVIVVGPVPIVLGTSQRAAKLLMVLAIALLMISVFAYIVFSRGWTW